MREYLEQLLVVLAVGSGVAIFARRVTIPDTHNRPEFIAGALEVALERAHVQPIITVEDRSHLGFRLLIRW